MSRQKTHEEFVSEVAALVGDEYTVKSTYKNATTKVTLRHNTCGRTYPVIPGSFVNGHRCPFCYRESTRKTPEAFTEEIAALVGDEYTVESTYKDSRTKVTLRHNTCGKTFSVIPGNFLQGSRCPYCAIEKRKKSS